MPQFQNGQQYVSSDKFGEESKQIVPPSPYLLVGHELREAAIEESYCRARVLDFQRTRPGSTNGGTKLKPQRSYDALPHQESKFAWIFAARLRTRIVPDQSEQLCWGWGTCHRRSFARTVLVRSAYGVAIHRRPAFFLNLNRCSVRPSFTALSMH